MWKKIKEENSVYSVMIESNKNLINGYRAKMKSLEELNAAYQEVINNNSVLVSVAEEEVSEIINKMIGKKIFWCTPNKITHDIDIKCSDDFKLSDNSRYAELITKER